MSDATFIDDDGRVKLRVYLDGGDAPVDSITKAVSGAAFIDEADGLVKVRIYTSGSDVVASNAVFNNESRSGDGTNHVTDTFDLSSGTAPTLAAGLFLSLTSSLPNPDPYTITNGTTVLTFSGGVVMDEDGTVCDIVDDEANSLIKIVVSVSEDGLQLDYTCDTGTLTITGGDMLVARLYKF